VLEVLGALRERGVTVLATTGGGADDLDDLQDSGALSGPTAWVFGTEAHGLSDAVLRAADRRVRIPLAPGVDSLNVAVAAAVALWALGSGENPPRD
jgi:TrmH family RNA methyltransferase